MNKLNDTGSATLKVLGDDELNQVVGGRGHWGRKYGGSHKNNGNRGGNGRRFGGGGNFTLNITIINNNNTTIVS